jgi:hypothetical protein
MAIMNALSMPVSHSLKRHQPLPCSVGKLIKDPDLNSNVSEVRASRMALEIADDDKNTQQQEKGRSRVRKIPWLQEKEKKNQITVPVPDKTLNRQETSCIVMPQGRVKKSCEE